MKRSLIVILGLLCMAPTAGDIGGCGATVSELNPEKYALDRKSLDCTRCTECGIGTARCKRACDPKQAADVTVPTTCRPLKHDGEVCLDKLESASCSAYTDYVADVAPATPTECQFCQYVPPGPLPTFQIDAGSSSQFDAGAP
jgi:hypothetical protein